MNGQATGLIMRSSRNYLSMAIPELFQAVTVAPGFEIFRVPEGKNFTGMPDKKLLQRTDRRSS
jgi:hypothetical protein